MYKLSFLVPKSHAERVKQAAFDAGAGRIGNYDHCAWQTLGEGQFRPLSGSSPYVGTANQSEKVIEYKVEMVCADACLPTVVAALRAAHPYEEPVIDAWPLVELD